MSESGLDILGKQLGNWKILLSPKALKNIQSLGRSGQIDSECRPAQDADKKTGNFGPIEEKLRDLASGSWSYHITGNEQQRKKLKIPLATTRCNPQTSILWQVDVGLDDTAKMQSQLVKIWEIGDKKEVSQSIDRVILLQKSYEIQHIAQCHQKPQKDAGGKAIPALFPASLETAQPGTRGQQGLDIRTIEREVLEMANRFYNLTEPMIRSVLANDLLAEFPFDLSGEETSIILHSGTSDLILGRSGTGKTICLVFKLLAKYAAGCAVTEERSPRQILLTRSTELAAKLKDYVNRLMKTLAANTNNQGRQEERVFPTTDAEDDGGDNNDCDTIFELRTGSFPLVCTFDRFLQLVENTVKIIDQEGFPVTDQDDDALQKEESDQSDSSEDERPRRQSSIAQVTRYIDFQSFKLDYWPRFPAAVVKNISIELVFAEIMGVIKSSISCRGTLEPLSRKAYLELSSKVAPTFTLESKKSRVYDIFEKYHALKLHRQELDGIDRVIKIIRTVKGNQRLKDYLAAAFDEIYIDEVQDLRCLDIELLLSIVNKGRAFHFAGDTAQTISEDSHFRFQDIKALFYDHFAAAATLMNQPELARPQLFMLAKNYRSHQGILGLASMIMEMLWNGFPETIDKLEPEVGQIHGSIPVFFLGCAVEMLASSDTYSADKPRQTLDFGAEQVIIVRDQITKAKVQAEFKDKALVLTVLQSKGMEFEDVFLWNFFTDSSCPGGWRCLDTLKTKSGNFDSTKHAGMCSELKRFYVAITRARIRLSIIESEEPLAGRVADLLKQDESSPLVEVTRSSDPDFLKELMSLRSISQDPRRWSERGWELIQRKQYEDAAICFRRAKDERGEVCATAYIFEEKGRRLTSINDTEAARQCFRSAALKFTELGMVSEAVRNLEKMEEYEEAAWLWARNDRPGKAAPLFAKGRLFREASDHYHQALSYDKAADTLRDGDLAEQFVRYVTTNQINLSSRTFRRHSRFCILLLKQGKLGSDLLAPAIKLLGSPTEQEHAFIDYEMHDQLLDLYAGQENFKQRFLLLTKIGKLGRALTAVSDLNASDTRTLQAIIRRVQDYYLAGQIIDPNPDGVNDPIHVHTSNSEWLNVKPLITGRQRIVTFEQIETMNRGLVKDLLQLHTLFNFKLLDEIAALDGVPFEAIEAALRRAESISSQTESYDPLILLLTGVMETEHETKPYVLLPWSPLHERISNANADEYPRVANQQFLAKLGSTILALDTILRKLWRSEWPIRCAHFLTRGYCDGIQTRGCPHLHKKITAAECSKKMSSLIQINAIFCRLTGMHRKKLMEEQFQARFSGLRRHWLENLLRELTFVSSFEQCAQTITETRSKIFSSRQNPSGNKGLSILAANMEDLLFHRLGKDWKERNYLSSVLEQVQSSQTLGCKVQERFMRCQRQQFDARHENTLDVLWALRNLDNNMGNPSVSEFRESLRLFIHQLHLAGIDQFSFFHSVTTVFEYLTTYLVFRSCPVAVLIPQSWIDLHLPWFAHIVQSPFAREIAHRDLRIYGSGLVELTMCYCQLLSDLDSLKGSGFRVGVSSYPTRLLHRRNTELLAFVIVNLGISDAGVEGFNDVWERVRQIFNLPHIRAFHLQHKLIPELLEKLAGSYKAYDGKDYLKLVRKTNGKYAAESKLQKLGLQAVSLAEVISVTSASRGSSEALTSSETDMENSRRLEAVKRIQQFWRSRYPKLSVRRTFMKTPAGRLYNQFLEICKQSAASKTIRYLLTGYGVELHQNIRNLSSAASELQQRAIDRLLTLPYDQFEGVDQAIERVSGIEESILKVAENISVERLEELAGGEVNEMQQLFRNADSVLGEIANDVREATKLVDDIEA